MDEQYKNTIEAVKFSIQMEIEGKNYYDNAADKSSNDAGRQLFTWLSEQEVKHKDTFESIFSEISGQNKWPSIKVEPDSTGNAKKVFINTVKSLGTRISPGNDEIGIINGAMELEEKTHQYYLKRSNTSENKTEKEFFNEIAAEENGHYLVLADYKEYIIDPAGYFLKVEKHTLDGA